MPDKTPSITVILPVFNGARYLGSAIESILGQSFTDFELLIINDGSTDASDRVARSYRDPRIRIIDNESNLGLIASLNRGIELARGEYIARQDADDLSLPDRFLVQKETLDGRSDTALVGSWALVIDEQGKVNGMERKPFQPLVIKWRLLFTNCFTHTSVMCRTAVLRAVNGYDKNMVHTEDYDLWSRIACGYGTVQIPRPLVKLRRHTGSVSSRHHEIQFATSVRIARKNMEDLLGRPVPLRTAEDLYYISMGLFREHFDFIACLRLVEEAFYAARDGWCAGQPDRRIVAAECA
ncbi:MAG: glycosyltransferase family 2 protein, partial [Endomicrobiales bacterium]